MFPPVMVVKCLVVLASVAFGFFLTLFVFSLILPHDLLSQNLRRDALEAEMILSLAALLLFLSLLQYL
jgi:hypothetical protein